MSSINLRGLSHLNSSLITFGISFKSRVSRSQSTECRVACLVDCLINNNRLENDSYTNIIASECVYISFREYL
ncbi:hypothetical protein BpHYR1_048384 [Brachionus plicatilis]|uniref:Uncharacterized protein n=1 Tax=Brachionus plicatilis TaxID=10195 RepID=A0A3M7QG07_BRAPC|nr:hypothetical protein BpHYR1_048384 [Brachionus plicatilis]